MAKRLIRVGTVGIVGLLALAFAPSAQAKYPPTIPNRDCIGFVKSPISPGRFQTVVGVPGCALRPNTQALTRTQVRFSGDLRRDRFGSDRGRYRFRFRVRRDQPDGRTRLAVTTGGMVFQRFPLIRTDASTPASAVLAPPSMTLPTLAAVATLAAGGWFMFAPVGRRRRLILRKAKAFGRRRR